MDISRGIRDYVDQNGDHTLTVTRRAFDFDRYKGDVDDDMPVIIFFRNPGQKIGHVVVGYGYLASGDWIDVVEFVVTEQVTLQEPSSAREQRASSKIRFPP